MKRCKHENADHLFASDWLVIDGRWISQAACEQLRCIDCGHWLSLGPSNDRGRAVSIEMRAARLAAKLAPLDFECHAVRDGWYCHRDGIGPGFDNVYGQAGYLARVIVTHDAAMGGG